MTRRGLVRRAAGARLAAAALLLAPLLALATACPGPGEENAPTLWLALDGRETEVKLVPYEPPYY